MYVMSTDRDFYQLVSDSAHILNTAGKSGQRVLGPLDIVQRYRVSPWQGCDFRALTGDPADNIAGVRGIGPITAARLLADGVRLEDLERLGRLTDKIGVQLKGCWDQLLRDRNLMRLREVGDLPPVLGSGISTWLPPAQVLHALDLW